MVPVVLLMLNILKDTLATTKALIIKKNLHKFMISHDYQFRVKYPDTHRMKTMNRTNYAKYYETTRWELFRSIGVAYSSM